MAAAVSSIAARAAMFRPKMVDDIFSIVSFGGISSRPRVIPAGRLTCWRKKQRRCCHHTLHLVAPNVKNVVCGSILPDPLPAFEPGVSPADKCRLT
jgi:hypothetical protein